MKKQFLPLLFIFPLVFTACNNTNSDHQKNLVEIIVLYTNDEHGWMEPTEDYDGAPGLMELWKLREGYDGSDNYLIISGGDMWTGPAISTWFQGEPMVEVMNAMEYDVSAVGNHEFDFKMDGLKERLEQMNFPLIAANLKYKSNGEIPEFAEPYIIKEIEGVKVGIIGLASLQTPFTTAPANIVEFEFTSYTTAIDEYAAKAKDEGADILVIAGHICEYEMEEILPAAKRNGILIIGGGHCHEAISKQQDSVVLIQSRSGMRAYNRVSFDYNKTTKKTENLDYELVWNNHQKSDTAIQRIVDYWVDQTQQELSEVVGYASTTIPRHSNEMANMICDSWLYTFPTADVSLTNAGGIRQDIEAGEIDLKTIVGVLPFDNNLIQLELTGAQLMESTDNFLLGGMTTQNGYLLLDGTPMHADSVYSVLITDYLYSLSDNNFSEYDTEPLNMYVNFRQPLIDWIKSLNTTSTDPLNNYLDYEPRK